MASTFALGHLHSAISPTRQGWMCWMQDYAPQEWVGLPCEWLLTTDTQKALRKRPLFSPTIATSTTILIVNLYTIGIYRFGAPSLCAHQGCVARKHTVRAKRAPTWATCCSCSARRRAHHLVFTQTHNNDKVIKSNMEEKRVQLMKIKHLLTYTKERKGEIIITQNLKIHFNYN